jgi:polysaccharide biosynthesis/export protein
MTMAFLLIASLLTLGVVEAPAFAPGGATAGKPAQGVAAQKPPVAPAKAPAAPPTAARSSDYLVGSQDVIRITIYGEPQLSGPIRIDTDGAFPFQYIGRVKAEGLTTSQIEANLIKALADGYLRNPQVSVEVLEYHSQSVFVTGEVRVPNKYSVQGDSSLMDVLTLAGSVLPTAGSYVLITHAEPGVGTAAGPAETVSATADLRVSLRDLQTGKAQSITVQDGDTIYVPKAERIFVLGAVRNSGAITYEEGMTILQAVSLAGGINEKGANRFAIRRVIKGQMKEFGAKAEDLVQPGDYVVVRNRRL